MLGGVQTQAHVRHEEIKRCRIVRNLLRMRAAKAGEEFVNLILRNSGKQRAWDNASRWQRLKWAWTGRIDQPHETRAARNQEDE